MRAAVHSDTGSDLLSLPGREGSQEGVQLVRKQPGQVTSVRTSRQIPSLYYS